MKISYKIYKYIYKYTSVGIRVLSFVEVDERLLIGVATFEPSEHFAGVQTTSVRQVVASESVTHGGLFSVVGEVGFSERIVDIGG